MQGHYRLMIGGVERDLRFNNFAHIELSKALFESGHLVSSPTDLIDKLLELSKQNIAVLLKALVYAGLVGHDYEVGFKINTSQEEVGKLIGTINEQELYGLWDVFLDAMGVNLSDLVSRNKEAEEAEEEKKS